MSKIKRNNFIAIAFIIFLAPSLSGCSAANEFENFSVDTDYKSIQFTHTSNNKNETITKLIVTLKNSGKKPIYVNGRFVFSIVTVANQLKAMSSQNSSNSFITTVPAQEMSILSSDSWTSVNEVFKAIGPYEKSSFIVAISLPNNTYIQSLRLVNRGDSKEQNIGLIEFDTCPYSGGSSSEYWSGDKKCEDGKLV